MIYVSLIEKVALEQDIKEGMKLVSNSLCGAGRRNSRGVYPKAKAVPGLFEEHPRGHRSWSGVFKARVAEVLQLRTSAVIPSEVGKQKSSVIRIKFRKTLWVDRRGAKRDTGV